MELSYLLSRTTVGVMPWLSVEWTTCLQAEREGGCAGSSNYTGNWACFIDCERARPVTKPLSVYMVYLKGGGGGGGRLVLLSLGQSHTSSWRITKQLRSETVVMLSYFYRHCVCPNCTCVKHKVQLRHGFVLLDMLYWLSVKLMWPILWRHILCTLILCVTNVW